jgi:hypothetical protein
MKQVVRKTATVVGVIIVLGALVSGKAESQSMPASPQTSGNPEFYPQQTSFAPDMRQMQMQMPGMNHHAMNMETVSENFLGEIQHHSTSGTSAEPNSTPMPMLMTVKGKWMLMFHGEAFLNALQQGGPRGADRIFSTNWFMPMAQRQFGPGTLTARIMLSLEPATITQRNYPELFQQGGTAFGKPIVDGQHPHDFIMELAALYDLNLGEQALLSFYFAPIGDPAMGPTAYQHRATASEYPIAPLGHHLEDSTHAVS